jgi:hypothetical protein
MIQVGPPNKNGFDGFSLGQQGESTVLGVSPNFYEGAFK